MKTFNVGRVSKDTYFSKCSKNRFYFFHLAEPIPPHQTYLPGRCHMLGQQLLPQIAVSNHGSRQQCRSGRNSSSSDARVVSADKICTWPAQPAAVPVSLPKHKRWQSTPNHTANQLHRLHKDFPLDPNQDTAAKPSCSSSIEDITGPIIMHMPQALSHAL